MPDAEQSEFTRTAIANIKEMRLERGLSAQDMANLLAERGSSLTRSIIANLETGRRQDITITEAMDLAAVFDVSLEWLVTAHGPKCNWCKDAPPIGYQCTTCRAIGEAPPCELCKGSGQIIEGEYGDMEATCPFCAGAGTQAVSADAA